MSDWTFWQRQLAGDNPDIGDGPQQGFYMRKTYVAGERKTAKGFAKRDLVEQPVAIWNDGDGWHCVINGSIYVRGVNDIEDTFARVARSAVSYEDYLKAIPAEEDAA